MADLSRRAILAGLLAAPVLAPAAAMGMVEAVKAKPFHTGGYVADTIATGYIGDMQWIGSPKPFSGRMRLAPMRHVAPLVELPADAEGDEAMVCEAFGQWHRQRFTNGQWVKVEDEAPEAPAIAQAEGHSGDVLDEDAGAFCAAV